MPAAPTARPHDTPLVPLSRGCAGEKGGGETNREERKREDAVGGERQIGKEEGERQRHSLLGHNPAETSPLQGTLLPSPLQLRGVSPGMLSQPSLGHHPVRPHLLLDVDLTHPQGAERASHLSHWILGQWDQGGSRMGPTPGTVHGSPVWFGVW